MQVFEKYHDIALWKRMNIVIFWALLCVISSQGDCHRIKSRFLFDNLQPELLQRHRSALSSSKISDKNSLEGALQLLNVGKETIGLNTNDPKELMKMVETKNSNSSSNFVQDVLQNSRAERPGKGGKKILHFTGDGKNLRLESAVTFSSVLSMTESNRTGIEDIFEMVLEKKLPAKESKEPKVVEEIKITETDRIKPISGHEVVDLVKNKKRKKRHGGHSFQKFHAKHNKRTKRTESNPILSITFKKYDTTNRYSVGEENSRNFENDIIRKEVDKDRDDEQFDAGQSMAEDKMESDNFQLGIDGNVLNHILSNAGMMADEEDTWRNKKRNLDDWESLNEAKRKFRTRHSKHPHRSNSRKRMYDEEQRSDYSDVTKQEKSPEVFIVHEEKVITPANAPATENTVKDEKSFSFWVRIAVIFWFVFMTCFSSWLVYSNCQWRQLLRRRGVLNREAPDGHSTSRGKAKTKYFENLDSDDDCSKLLEWQSENGDWLT